MWLALTTEHGPALFQVENIDNICASGAGCEIIQSGREWAVRETIDEVAYSLAYGDSNPDNALRRWRKKT